MEWKGRKMRKVLTFFMLLFLIVAASNAVAAQDANGVFTSAIGLDFNMFGTNVIYNGSGSIVAASYINLGLGITFKNFFSPVEFNKFNFYWQWGTICLIIPFIGVGGEYIASSGFYFGIGLYYFVAPMVYIGKYF